MSTGFRKAALITLPLLVALGALAVWNPSGNYWGSVEPPKAQVEAYDTARLSSAKVLDASLYNLAKLDRIIREPQNTVSNLAYIMVGIAVTYAARRALSKSFGLACVFLGIGSGLYHASLLPEWRMLDILGVYAALFGLLGVASSAILRVSADLPLVVSTWIPAFYTGIHRNDVRIGGLKILDSKYVVVGCVVLGSLLALSAVRLISDRSCYVRWVMALAFSAGIAFFGGIADRFGGVWALPEALIQGHAVWHTFGGVALLASYEIFAMTGYDRSVFATPSRPNQALEPATAVAHL